MPALAPRQMGVRENGPRERGSRPGNTGLVPVAVRRNFEAINISDIICLSLSDSTGVPSAGPAAGNYRANGNRYGVDPGPNQLFGADSRGIGGKTAVVVPPTGCDSP